MNRTKLMIIMLAGLVISACSACKHAPADKPVINNQATVTVRDGKVITTTAGKNGQLITLTSQSTQPDNYPKDIPPFPDGTDSTYNSTADASVITLQSYAAKDKREVANYFEHELTAAGWTANITTSEDKIEVVKADKNGRKIEIQVLPYTTGCKVLLSYNATS